MGIYTTNLIRKENERICLLFRNTVVRMMRLQRFVLTFNFTTC